ncbi:Peptidase family S51 [Lysobacter silvestris]|uniref:Peptidase family S51 n=2 Tax=Solilutibacter silvestris TaxID=1645665 RepID=A0A2K1PXP9_9GAMM|nr:Peptidase family S51 [Lysobacter silvestris]
MCALFLAACASAAPKVAQSPFDYYRIGEIAAKTPGKVRPGLMLLGGGDWPYAAFHWLFDRAGNGHIVVLRASYGDENQREIFDKIGGVTSVETLVFHDRKASFDPKVLAVITHADGIWIAGGDQSNYVNFWKGTPVQDALNRHVASGKPLGGTSAGLAVQGRYVYGAMDGGSLTSKEALADSRARAVTIVEDFLRLEPLYSAGVLTDTHFNQRDRQVRLMTMMAQVRERHPARPLLGIGIDEQTALCIDGDGQGVVFSDNGGHAWLFRIGHSSLQKNGPLRADDWQVTLAGRGSRIDTRDWRVAHPDFTTTASIRDGRLEYAPPLQP